MLTATKFRSRLDELGLTLAEAAQLLSVSSRTVQRWMEGEEIPGPAARAVDAWAYLHKRGLAWRPDAASIASDDAEQIAIVRSHAVELEALMKRVKARGGPAAPWHVDLDRCTATLGPLQVTFYKLKNGGFSPQSYRRSDGVPFDRERDWPLVEDAFVCIAQAFAKQGDPLHTRFAFMGPSLENGRLLLWEMSLVPPIVAVIPCQAMREVMRGDRDLADAECRLIVLNNMSALTALAERLFNEGRVSVRDGDMAIRAIEIGAADLKTLSKRFFNLSVLGMQVKWGVR